MALTKCVTFLVIGLTSAFLCVECQQNSSLCKVPNTIQSVSINPSRTVGTWYTWMFNSPGPMNYNLMFTYTPLGMVNDKLALSWYSSFWMLDPKPSCNAMFAQHYLGTDGTKTGTSFMSSPLLPPTPESTTYYTLYTDYDSMEIIYRCMKPGQTGTCDMPLIMVNTRVYPAMLSQTAQTNMAKIIFNTLSQFCDAKSMRMVSWDWTLSPCNPPALSTIRKMV